MLDLNRVKSLNLGSKLDSTASVSIASRAHKCSNKTKHSFDLTFTLVKISIIAIENDFS